MITVVIPNYNGEKILRPCFESLKKQTLEGFEVIIVDNASIDSSVSIIEEFGFKIIKNEINRGFAPAVNQGIKAAEYEYVFLLNSDVVLSEDTLEVLLREIQSNVNYFSVQPKMMQYYEPHLIDDAGDIYTPFGWAFQLGHGLPDKYHINKRTTFSCCAGAALYRKDILEKIGYFDESFFAYMEDVDLGYRALRIGYRNYYTPETKVFHIGSASFGKTMTPLRAALSGQNNYLAMRNNMPLLILIWNAPLLFIGFSLKYLKFKRLGFGKEFLQGIKNGTQKFKVAGRKPKIGRCDLRLQLEMYIDTFKFIQWKIRQIIEKR